LLLKKVFGRHQAQVPFFILFNLLPEIKSP
jgi:hypothetical protein